LTPDNDSNVRITFGDTDAGRLARDIVLKDVSKENSLSRLEPISTRQDFNKIFQALHLRVISIFYNDIKKNSKPRHNYAFAVFNDLDEHFHGRSNCRRERAAKYSANQ